MTLTMPITLTGGDVCEDLSVLEVHDGFALVRMTEDDTRAAATAGITLSQAERLVALLRAA